MKKRAVLAVIAVIFILFCFFPVFLSRWKGIYLDASSKPLHGLEAVSNGLENSVFFLPRFIRTYRENSRLKKEVESLQKSLLELKEVSLENERLRSALSLKKESPYKMTAAQIIGRDYSNWVNTVLINKGALDGLKTNMVAVAPSGLVGKIIEVNRSTSIVLLLIDSDCRVTGLAQRTRDEGIVEGYFGRLRMKYLDPKSEVKSGDIVITSGYGENYPKGLLIGKITGVANEPGNMYKYALIQPAVSFFRLEEVLCIQPSR